MVKRNCSSRSRSTSLSTPGFTDATSATSADEWELDSRPPSPAPSVYSVTDSIIAQSYRAEYGRKLNNYSEVYRLPADDEEIARLQKQHRLFEDIMGKYPPGLWQAMQDEPGIIKAALDLGCGCGSWIMGLARDFPNCIAVGVDLVPMQSLDMPNNCRSEIDDINLGLEHFYGEFDVVNARLIASGITDYAGLVEHISRVVRPGGLVSLAEWDFRVYDEKKQYLKGDSSDPVVSYVAKFCAAVGKAARARGGNIDAATLLYRWCSDNRSFESVEHADYWIPASTWWPEEGEEGDKLRSWGAGMRDDSLLFLKGARPLLLGHGMGEDELDELVEKATQELLNAKLPIWARCQRVTARRRK